MIWLRVASICIGVLGLALGIRDRRADHAASVAQLRQMEAEWSRHLWTPQKKTRWIRWAENWDIHEPVYMFLGGWAAGCIIAAALLWLLFDGKAL